MDAIADIHIRSDTMACTQVRAHSIRLCMGVVISTQLRIEGFGHLQIRKPNKNL